MATVEARAGQARPILAWARGSGAARAAAWVVLGGLGGWMAAAEAERAELPPGVSVRADVAYRPGFGRNRRLDIYTPEGPVPPGGRPVVVAIHGGGWRGGSKGGFGRMAARLAEHGYVVLAPAYTLSGPDRPSWPANLEDLREAVRWARRHADELGADPGRIAALGASAGGHLAALLGMYPDGPVVADAPPGCPAGGAGPGVSARVQAVVSFYGPADLRTNHAESPPARPSIEGFLGGDPAGLPGRYAAASPVEHASPDDAPALLIHGSADPTVPPGQSAALAEALGRAGVEVRHVVVEGAAHGFGFRVEGRDLLPDVVEFLDAALGRSGPP